MSFSTEVKEELSKLNNLANKDCVKAEMYGYLSTNNISKDNGYIKFSTENEYNINRFAKLLNNLNINKYDIDIVGKSFSIKLTKSESNNLKTIFDSYEIENNENVEKAYIRGVFLGSGSINNPQNKYHIEIILNSIQNTEKIIKILNKYGINFKVLYASNENKSKDSIYSKDGEEISKFLAFIGASSAVLKFEEIRVYRDMRNNVNRIVNCETANLAKTVDASVKQINAINKLKESGKFNDLPENLKELANLRIENPESSLIELGKMLKESVGKSGVNYRMKKILKLSEE